MSNTWENGRRRNLNLERLEGRILLSGLPVGSEQIGGVVVGSQQIEDVVVTFYDSTPTNEGKADISPDIAWNRGAFQPGTTDVVLNYQGATVSLHGNSGQTEGLGISIESTSTDSVGRSYSLVDARSGPTSLGFFAVEGPMKTVSLRSEIIGADVDGIFNGSAPASLQNQNANGGSGEQTAIFATDSAQAIFLRGGDLDGDVLIGGSLDLMRTVSGDIEGDITVGAHSDGTPDSAEDLLTLHVVQGNIEGDVTVAGSATRIMAVGGNVEGDVTIGEFDEGNVDPNGNLGTLKTLHGDISGDVTVGGNAQVIAAVGGSITGEVKVGGNLHLLQAVRGGISGPVDVNGNLNTAMAIDGDIGPVDVEGNARAIRAVRGDISGPVDVGGKLTLLHSNRGSITGDVNVGHASSGGGLVNLVARGGNIDGDIDVDGDARLIQAIRQGGGGAVNGNIEIGGGVTVLAAGNDLTGDVDVTDALSRVVVRGDMTPGVGDDEVSMEASEMNVVRIAGRAHRARIGTDGRLGKVHVRGDFENSTLDTGWLNGLSVGGFISEDAHDADEDYISAGHGLFFVRHRGGRGWVDRGPRFGPRQFGGVPAFVGPPQIS